MAERCEKEASEREPASHSMHCTERDANTNNKLSTVIVSGSGTSCKDSGDDNKCHNQQDDLSENIASDVSPYDLKEENTNTNTSINISSDADKAGDKFQEFRVHETNFTKGQLILKLKTTKSSCAVKMSDSVQECGESKGDTWRHYADTGPSDMEESTSKKKSDPLPKSQPSKSSSPESKTTGVHHKSKISQGGTGEKDKDVSSSESSETSSSHDSVKRKTKTMDADVTILDSNGTVQFLQQPGILETNPNVNTEGVVTQVGMSHEEEQCLLQAIVDCNTSSDNIPVGYMDPIASSIMCQQTLEIGIPQHHIVVPSGSVELSKGGIETTPPVESQVTCRTENEEMPNEISTTEEIVSTDIPVPIDTGLVVEVSDLNNAEDVVSLNTADVVVTTPDFGYRSYAHNFGADAIIMSEKESDVTPNVTGDELDLESHTNATSAISMSQYTVHSGYSPKSRQNGQRTPKTSPTIKKTKLTEPTKQNVSDTGQEHQTLLKPANAGNSRTSKVRTKDTVSSSHNKKVSPKKSPTVGKKLTTSKKGKLSKSATSVADSPVTMSSTKPKKTVKKSKSSEIKISENLSPSHETSTLSKHKKAKKTKAKSDSLAVKSPKPKKAKLSDKNDSVAHITKTKSSKDTDHSHSKHKKKNIKLSVDEVFDDTSPDEAKPKKHKSKSKGKKLSVDDVFEDTSPDESTKPKKHKSKSKSKKSSKHKSTHSKILHSPSSLSSSSSLCISPVQNSSLGVKCKSSKSNKSRTKSSLLSPTLSSGKSSSADSHSPHSTGKSSKIKKSKSSSKKKSHSKSSVLPKPASISPFSGTSSCSTDFVTNAFAEIAKAALKEKTSNKSNSKSKKHKSSKSHSKSHTNSSDMLLKVAHKKSKSSKKHGKSKSGNKKTKKVKSKSSTVNSPPLLPSTHGLLTTVTSPTAPLHILIPDNETHVPQRQSPPRSSSSTHLLFSPTYKDEISRHLGSPPRVFSTKAYTHSSPGRAPSTGCSPIRSPDKPFRHCLVKPSHVFAEPVRVSHNDVSRKRDGQTPSPQSATTCLSEETLFSDSGVGTDNNSNPDQHHSQHIRRIPSATESVTSEMLETHPLATSAHGLYSYGKREKHRKHMGWHYGSIKRRRRKYRSYSRPHGRISPAFVFELDALIHELRALRLDGPQHSPFGLIYNQPPAKNHLSAKINPIHKNTYLRPSYLATAMRNNSQQKAVKHKSSKKKKKSKNKHKEKGSSDAKHCLVSPDNATSQSEISISEASPLKDTEDQTKGTEKSVEDSNSSPASGGTVIKATASPEKAQSTQSSAQETTKTSPGKSKAVTRPRASRIQSFIDANMAMGMKLQPIAESVKLKKRNKSIRRDDSTGSITSTTSNTAQTVKKTKKVSSSKGKKVKKSPSGHKKGKKQKHSPKKSVKGTESKDDTDNVPDTDGNKPKKKGKTSKAKSPKKKHSKKKYDSPSKGDVPKADTTLVSPYTKEAAVPTQINQNSKNIDKTSDSDNVSREQSVDKGFLLSPVKAVTNDSVLVAKDLPSKSKNYQKKKTSPTKGKTQKGKTATKGGKGKKKNSTSNKTMSQTSPLVKIDTNLEIASTKTQQHLDDDESDVEILPVTDTSYVEHSNVEVRTESDVLIGKFALDSRPVTRCEIAVADKVKEDVTKSDSSEAATPPQQHSEVVPAEQSSEVTPCQHISVITSAHHGSEETTVQSLEVPPPQQKPGAKRKPRRRGRATYFTPKSKARANRLKAALAKANAAKSPPKDELTTGQVLPLDETHALQQTEKNTDCLESTEIIHDQEHTQNQKDLATNVESESDSRIAATSNETEDAVLKAKELTDNAHNGEKVPVEPSNRLETDNKESQLPGSSQCQDISNESVKDVQDVLSNKVEESPKRRRRVLANKKSNSKPSSRSSSAESSTANKNVQSVEDVKFSGTSVEKEKEESIDGRTRKGKKVATNTKTVTLKAMKDAIDASIEDAIRKHSEEEKMKSAFSRQNDILSGKVLDSEANQLHQNTSSTVLITPKRVANDDKMSSPNQVSEAGGSAPSAKGTKRRKAAEEQAPDTVTSEVVSLQKVLDPVCEDPDAILVNNEPKQALNTTSLLEAGVQPVAAAPNKRQAKKPGPSAIKRQRVVNKKQGTIKSKQKDNSETVPSESGDGASTKMQPVVAIAISESQMAETVLEKVPKSKETHLGSVNNTEPDVIIISDNDVPMTSTGQVAGSSTASACESPEVSSKQATTKKKAALTAKASVIAKAVTTKPASALTAKASVIAKAVTTKPASALTVKASVIAKSVAAQPVTAVQPRPTVVKKKGDVPVDESSIPLKKRKLMKQPLDIDVDYNCLSPEHHLQTISPTPLEITPNSTTVKPPSTDSEQIQAPSSTTIAETKDAQIKGKTVKGKTGKDKQKGKGKKKKAPAQPPKRKYWKAGIYSSTYKEDVITPLPKMKKIDTETIELEEPEQETSEGGTRLLPLPILEGNIFWEEADDFQLPYDIWWSSTHKKLPDRKRPPKFRKIRTNIYYDVKPVARTESNACCCIKPREPVDPSVPAEKGCQEDCLNRIVYNECSASECPCGELCANQRIQKHQSSTSIERFMTPDCGWGIRTKQPVKAGDFIIEYVGEVISVNELWKRSMDDYQYQKHHYCLNLDGSTVIDGFRCGNESRFVNHSCQPNCEMQKWSVNGLYRIGLFALRDIPNATEISYDYNFHAFNLETQQICKCGSENCRGSIGGKGQRPNGTIKKGDQSSSGESQTSTTGKKKKKNKNQKKIGKPKSKETKKVVEIKPSKPKVEIKPSKPKVEIKPRKQKVEIKPSKQKKKPVEVAPEAPPIKHVRLKIPRPMSMREVNLIASRQLFLLRNIEKVKRVRQRLLMKSKGEKSGNVVGSKPTSSKDNGKDVFMAQFTALKTPRSVKTRRLAAAEENTEVGKAARLAQVFKDIYTAVCTYRNPCGQSLAIPFLNLPTKKRNPDYFSRVPDPIDLSTVERNIMSGNYKTVGQFDEALLRVFKNAEKYHGKKSVLGRDASALRKAYFTAKQDAIQHFQDILGETPKETNSTKEEVKMMKEEEEEEIIRCLCGLLNDEGLMIQCEKCMIWQHCDCLGMDEPSEKYMCEMCEPRPDVPKEIAMRPQPPYAQPGQTYYLCLQRDETLSVKQGDAVYLAPENERKNPDGSPMQVSPHITTSSVEPESLNIFRIEKLWKNEAGERFAFGHHFLRPHETHHTPSRKFFKNELFRVPLYEILRLDSVLGICCVMDFNTYCKGRPYNFKEQDIYVSEYRLDKTAHLFNPIGKNRYPICTKNYAFEKFEKKMQLKRDYSPHHVPEHFKRGRATPKDKDGGDTASEDGGNTNNNNNPSTSSAEGTAGKTKKNRDTSREKAEKRKEQKKVEEARVEGKRLQQERLDGFMFNLRANVPGKPVDVTYLLDPGKRRCKRPPLSLEGFF